jgi:hypothetical protein
LYKYGSHGLSFFRFAESAQDDSAGISQLIDAREGVGKHLPTLGDQVLGVTPECESDIYKLIYN